jgi:LSD1 subclass zinc finger protein
MNENPLTFECPSCGASLQNPGGAASMKCGYCGTTVVVPEALRTVPQPNAGRASPPAANISQLFAQAMEMGAIVRLARNGDKADAIRLYQENTGASAEQAGLVIDAMVSGNMANAGMENEFAAITTREAEAQPRRPRRTRQSSCSGTIALIILIVGAYFVIQNSPGVLHDLLNHLIVQLNLANFFH